MPKLSLGAQKLELHLSPRQLEQFDTYYQELVVWNRRMNLTTITDYEEVQIKHFLDALTVALAYPSRQDILATRLIDVGTGAGIPGMPLKIVFPRIRLVLLEATAKKATFLYHLTQKLGFDDVEIVVGRAEETAHQSKYRGQFDLVLARAVASLPALVELALPFCAVGGHFIAYKKGGSETEINRAAKAITTLGGKLRGVSKVDLKEFTEERWLVVIDKVAPTPPQYPRRSGVPNKRPLG